MNHSMKEPLNGQAVLKSPRDAALQMWWSFGRVAPWYWGDVGNFLHGAAMVADSWDDVLDLMMLRDVAREHYAQHQASH